MDSNKLPLRRTRKFYEDPPAPETGAYKFRVEKVISTGDRINHWPGGAGDDDDFYEYERDEPETAPEYSGELAQCIPFTELLERVKKHNLDEKKLFITAAMYDDHLVVEVVNIQEQSEEEQLLEYRDHVQKQNKSKQAKKEQELQSIEWRIEALKKQAEELKK